MTLGRQLSSHASASKLKSAIPCTIAFFSIVFGRTVNAGGRLLSPPGNTFASEHFGPFSVDGCTNGFFHFFPIEVEGRLFWKEGASERRLAMVV
ncbi:hypothetical protein PAXRUDRAFT_831477 [Paxillus rubicundulus Ve08.2h10]|uniref:Uncharacterized protein n=1 Tax=Paxillus rubicundulus Ve08.2h10 TaxID=930991 RepID=A0A0D0DI88_9AGAM|nr:hypothetical protein PAXRUDRAFT_831477 [Paxillus rubicundulus Ve08.2h10]